jgi:hypothetical protein
MRSMGSACPPSRDTTPRAAALRRLQAACCPFRLWSAKVESDVEEHQDSLVLQVQEVGLFAPRYHVNQPRTED